MKPIKLTMTAFQAYGGTQTIDFRVIGDKGLFLVTGNTGTGKTTIFDAMTYALYGKPSGSARPVDSVRSHFAGDNIDTVVEFIFMNRGKEYTVSRSPARTKGKGISKRSKEVSLKMPDGSAITTEALVSEEIEKILGLDEKQWSQVVMLAQGEFVRLLNSESKERAEIFQKIFQTQIYRAVQEMLKKKYEGLDAELESINKEIETKFGSTEYQKDSEAYQAFERIRSKGNLVYNRAEALDLLDSAIGSDKVLMEEQSQKRKEIQKQKDSLSVEKAKADSLALLLGALEENNKVLALLDEQKPAMDSKALSLARSEKALDHIKPIFDKMTEVNTELEKSNGKKAGLETTRNSLQKELSEAENVLNIAKDNAKEIPELIRKIAEIDMVLPSYAAFTEANEHLQNSEEELRVLLDNKKNLTALREVKDAGKREHIEFVNQYPNVKVDLQSKITEKEGIDGKIKKAKSLLSEVNKYQKLESEKQAKAIEYGELERRWKDTSAEVNAAEELFYRSQAGIMAEKLKEGEPCPVCGSTNHPSKASLSGTVSTEEQIKKLKGIKDAAEGKLREMSGKISSIQGTETTVAEHIEKEASELELILADLSGNSCIIMVTQRIAELDKMSVECATACSSLAILAAEYVDRSETLAALDKEGLRLTDEINEIDPQINALTADVISSRASAGEMSKGMQYASEKDAIAAKSGFSDKKGALSNAEAVAQEKRDYDHGQLLQTDASLRDVNERIENQSASKLELVGKFSSALAEQGFEDADEFARFVIEREQLNVEKKKISEFEEKYRQTLQKKEVLVPQTEGKELPDMDAIKEKSESLELEMSDAIKGESLAISRKKNNENIRTQLTSAWKKYDEVESTTTKVKAMSDTANGALKGSEKITFEQYVQGVYFDEVIQRASKRLGMMSNNRFVLIRKKEADDLRKNSSLDMEVLDNHSGKTRPVRSLSGGESFKAALALALGLSDTIQSRSGGVNIETLFIDEGFGSLDADSLDQAVTVLDQLSANNALVGIISHVDTLKERIDKKIVVKHDESGSRAEIIVD